MKLPNINCKCYDRRGNCNKKPKQVFGLIKADCSEVAELFSTCEIAERYPKPQLPPPCPKV